MAKMIPAWIDSQSTAENRVFDLLASDPATKDWTVLHSLGLSRTAKWPYGEIDFVVIVPHEGIICLEVKGGGVSCQEGDWQTIDRNGIVHRLTKSPWDQARVSMQALRKSVSQHFREKALGPLCPFGCAVVFPDVTCPPPTPEFEPCDAIDYEDLRQPISKSIVRLALKRLRELQPPNSTRLPTAPEIRVITTYLRPDFDMIPVISASLERTETRLLRLTEEQYDRLDELEENDRCLFKGAAGTGKTLLALEYARRAGRAGSKVLLVCKNLLLGHWLCQQVENMEGVTAGAWYEIARDLIMGGNDDSLKNEFQKQERELSGQGYTGQNTLYNELYPLYLASTLDEKEPPYDVLVVDEAQDLVKPHILNSFNLIVRGGLAGGRWAVFGDPLQSILDTVQFVAQFDGPHDVFSDPLHLSEPTEYLEKALSSYSKSFVKAKLTKNCRNTQPIAEKTAALTGLEKPPFTLNREAGLPVEKKYWRTPSDLLRLLKNRVDHLTTSERVPIQNIVLLSPYKLKTSRLSGVEKISRFPLTNISNAQNVAGAGELKFSNIKSFKGLESQVVIIVDIDRIDEDEHRAFLYVAMSRARSLLILMIHENIREEIEPLIGRD